MHYYREQIEEQISELERLKRSLRAKEEVELSQIDAVYSLTARTKTLEKEITTLQKQLENMMHNADNYKKNLDTTKMLVLLDTSKILYYIPIIIFITIYNYEIIIFQRII